MDSCSLKIREIEDFSPQQKGSSFGWEEASKRFCFLPAKALGQGHRKGTQGGVLTIGLLTSLSPRTQTIIGIVLFVVASALALAIGIDVDGFWGLEPWEPLWEVLR